MELAAPATKEGGIGGRLSGHEIAGNGATGSGVGRMGVAETSKKRRAVCKSACEKSVDELLVEFAALLDEAGEAQRRLALNPELEEQEGEAWAQPTEGLCEENDVGLTEWPKWPDWPV